MMQKLFPNLRLRIKDMLPGQGYNMTDLEQLFNEHHLHAVFKLRQYIKKLQYIRIVKSTQQYKVTGMKNAQFSTI
jgi:hypothetical protein